MRSLKTISQPIDALTPYANNARTHSKKQIRQIAASIEAFGWTNPVLVDASGGIIAGHGRVEAAKLLGLTHVPTIPIEDLSAAQKRAYILADNKLAERAGWDVEILATELQGLLDLELDIDLTVTGFETPEIDLILGSAEEEESDDPTDSLPELGPAVTRPGDLWQIGPHRLICGDALDPAVYERLLGGERAQMVFTDPPYNVPIDGHVCGLGKVKHRDFAMAAGEMTEAAFTGFLEQVFRVLADHSADGALHFVCMDWRHMGEVITAGKAAYSELKNLCVWAKTNGGMGSLYRSQHELVFLFKVGTGSHINNVELGKHGRYRTNLWTYPGINTFGKDRNADLALHPTVKPIEMVADAIMDCSKRGGLILDAFAGSGTTLLAAEKTGRHGAGIELDPGYCDIIIRRFTAQAGPEAVEVPSGKTFDTLASERGIEAAADATAPAEPEVPEEVACDV